MCAAQSVQTAASVAQLLRHKVPESNKENIAQSINTVVQRLRLLKGSSLEPSGIRAYLRSVQEDAEALRSLLLTPPASKPSSASTGAADARGVDAAFAEQTPSANFDELRGPATGDDAARATLASGKSSSSSTTNTTATTTKTTTTNNDDDDDNNNNTGGAATPTGVAAEAAATAAAV